MSGYKDDDLFETSFETLPHLNISSKNLDEISLYRSSATLFDAYNKLTLFMDAGTPTKGLILCALVLKENDTTIMVATTVKALSSFTGMSTTTVYTTLRALEEEGKVTSIVGTGRSPATYFIDRNFAMKWLQSVEGRSFDKWLTRMFLDVIKSIIPKRFKS